MDAKKTLVVGASIKNERYSNKAVRLLKNYDHEVYAYGLRSGEIDGVEISTEWPQTKDIHTVTMYIGSQNQSGYYSNVIALNPKRVIFNPGTENNEFKSLLRKNDIEVVEYCTLVMLNQGMF